VAKKGHLTRLGPPAELRFDAAGNLVPLAQSH
jgi:hypothetical protein